MSGVVVDSSARLLVLAPHPDDESLACGGLIQQALAAGAAVRVIVATDGDNNPWPQRWAEKRLRIDSQARARWGARRRAEARSALHLLGVSEANTIFLGWPDLGLTYGLKHNASALCGALRAAWSAFDPTHVALPLARDTHPDHSALHILARAVARSLDAHPLGLGFAVHGGRPQGALVLPLDPAQLERKRAAVLAHTSQTTFGRGRLLRFVQDQETYGPIRFDRLESAARVPCDATSRRERHVLLGITVGGEVLCLTSEAALPSPPPEWGDVVELWHKCERRRRGLLVFDRSGWTPLRSVAG